MVRARKEGSPLTISAVANTDIKDHMNNVSLSIFKVVIQKKLIDLVTEFQILSLLNWLELYSILKNVALQLVLFLKEELEL